MEEKRNNGSAGSDASTRGREGRGGERERGRKVPAQGDLRQMGSADFFFRGEGGWGWVGGTDAQPRVPMGISGTGNDVVDVSMARVLFYFFSFFPIMVPYFPSMVTMMIILIITITMSTVFLLLLFLCICYYQLRFVFIFFYSAFVPSVTVAGYVGNYVRCDCLK